ncbi:hypothetical protein [Saliphagus infecundisoli]|uniref:Uncharacterized protein n=1 Tax=Saliphagus infecundisoli TaxID=1849069 RepID=A0ABD5QC63_9EURY|nr:hypothetical protein [Saliphagus infecundisoli]
MALEESYTPRVDVVWYLDLRELGLDTTQLSDYFGFEDDEQYRRFPLVAFEIEASDPTTKTMTADLANLQAIGAPIGILIVDEEREGGLYRRGKRIVRTFRQLHGHTNCLCLDRSHLTDLVNREWGGSTDQPAFEHDISEGAGGEKEWSTRTRRQLADMGKEMGFVVKEDWIPDDLSQAYDRHRDLWQEADGTTDHEQYAWDPEGERKTFRGWRTYYTGSKIDLTWTMPYPASFKEFLTAVVDLDPDFETHTPLLREAESLHPLYGFELESSAGKHAAGGVLNLGAYPTVGQIVVPNETKRRRIETKIETYEQALGIRNVETQVMDHD